VFDRPGATPAAGQDSSPPLVHETTRSRTAAVQSLSVPLKCVEAVEGESDPVQVDTLTQLAEAFGVDVSRLLERRREQ